MNQKERVAFVEHLGGPGPWSESVIKNVIEYNPAAWAAWQARAALAAEPAQPVAWQCRAFAESGGWNECGKEAAEVRAKHPDKWQVRALYAAPQPAAQPAPERQPLTDAEITAAQAQHAWNTALKSHEGNL